MLRLAIASLVNRRFVAFLTVLSIALSVMLILGVERLRDEARESFTNSASGIDLIVAARGSPVQILMATVFGVGSTTAGLGWDTYEMVENRPEVNWAVPIQMGDNHKGFPVIGTSPAYFDRFRHSGGQALAFAAGIPFSENDLDGAVVGAEVAARFDYAPGSVIVNAHGSGEVAFDVHDEAPFKITGILGPTGTAVDRMVIVSLEGFDALHDDSLPTEVDPLTDIGVTPKPVADEEVHRADDESEHAHEENYHTHGQNGLNQDHEDAHLEGPKTSNDSISDHDHTPEMINAILVGLTDRAAVLGIQRAIAEYPGEALTAVLPNVALLELWSITGTAETALRLMAWVVALAGMIGLVVMLSATLEARRREFAILRSVGGTPAKIFGLILVEAAVLTIAGLAAGMVMLAAATLIADPILSSQFGIRMGLDLISSREAGFMAAILCAGLLAALVPAFRVYRMTLSDGLSPRL
jgi:putative ABC transport system permease protein